MKKTKYLIGIRGINENSIEYKANANEYYKQIDKDIDNFFRNSVLKIDDGDGNIVELPVK